MAFINGVDTAALQITSLGTQVGSWLGNAGTLPNVGDIIVAKNGSVIKVASIVDVNTYSYTVLQADAADVQAGMEYPNVVRQLQDDGIANPLLSEWYYYDNGGAYPWPGGLPNQLWFNPAGSNTAPYDTKAKGATLMSTVTSAAVAGSNVILVDGAYTAASPGWDIEGASYLWEIIETQGGTEGNPITYMAESDGGVTIDSENTRTTLRFRGVTDVTMQGIVFRRGELNCVVTPDSNPCTRLSFYRCSAWDGHATPGGNNHLWSISTVTDLIMEDCAGGGTYDYSTGRNILLVFKCIGATIRRFAGIHRGYDGGSFGAIGQVYNTENATIDNLIGTLVQPAVPTPTNAAVTGFNNWSFGHTTNSSNNHFTGCVVWDLDTPSTLTNDGGFSDSSDIGMNPPGNINVTHDDMAVINCGMRGFSGEGNNTDWGDGTFGTYRNHCVVANDAVLDVDGNVRVGCMADSDGLGTIFKNSVILTAWGGLDQRNPATIYNTYNCIYNCTNDYHQDSSAGVGEVYSDPAYDTATFGYGAYLMRPAALAGLGEGGGDMGADVRFKVVDGVTTSDPLWPWPMEDRIAAESGFSITYSADPGGSLATTFIGPWLTLAGVYP